MVAEQRPSRHRGDRNIGNNAAPARGGKGYFFSGVLFVLLSVVAGAGYWHASEVHKTLADTRRALEDTRTQLSQITGQVSQTGETITQSDSTFRSELKTVNSEIRKLWDVTNKRNRQWITDNKESVEKLQKQVDDVAKQARDGKTSASQAITKLSEIDQVVKALAAEQLAASLFMTSNVDGLKAEIASLKKQARELQLQASNGSQEELGQKLSSFQSQVFQRLLQVENTVRELKNPSVRDLTIQ